MSNQQDPHDEFGGFGESDDQTFLHDSSKSSSAKTPMEDSIPSAKTEGKEYSTDAQSGFISYVKPEVSEEEEQSSLKKVGLIALLTIAAAATIWMILPSKEEGDVNPGQIVAVDTIPEKEEEVQDNTPQKTTLEQDSIARVQDYLARMQMSQGKNIGNNERSDEYAEEQAPIAQEQKAPEKKVIPPDPIPAKTFPEYRDAPEPKQAESIQKDEPAKVKPTIQKPMPIVKKPNPEKVLAQKSVNSNKTQKAKEKVIAQKQKEQKQVIDETFENGNTLPNTGQSKITNSNEEYAVQVMSSISKDEANKALKNLKSKGISSASITKKSLNGKTWYRVRFGSFDDRKQAQNAAKKAGYSNSWIDRVK